MKTDILTLIFCMVIFSCSNESELYNPDRLIKVDNDYNVKEKPSLTIDTIAQVIVDVHSMDDYLIVLTTNSEYLINVYNVKDNKWIGAFGCKGNAKNEFDGSFFHSYLSKSKDGDVLLSVVQSEGTMTKTINVNKSIEQGNCCIERIIKHNEDISGTFSRPYFTGDSSYICYHEVSYSSPLDKIYFPPYITSDFKGKIETKTVFPNVIKSDMINTYFCAYSFAYSIRPDFRKSVNAMKSIDIINFVDNESLEVTGLFDKNSVNMSYFEKDITESNLAEKIRFYNIDICSSSEKVFVLKTNGVTYQDIRDNKPFSEYIFVYDWDGNMLDSFKLNDNLDYIAYNEKYNVLFGVDSEGKLIKINYTK